MFAQTDIQGRAGGMRGFDRPTKGVSDPHSASAPVVTYTLYNPPAFEHIRRHGLYGTAGLERLREGGMSPKIPPFPVEAMIAKTAWWPVAAEGLTALPVWDEALNPPQNRGNPYVTWRKVVAVDPAGKDGRGQVPIAFMGRSYSKATRVGLDAFHHVVVDPAMAKRLSQDAESRRSAAIALGRPIQAGDHLVLVGLNLMTNEQEDWVWAALWWHDQPDVGSFAADRPKSLAEPWSNYLMQAAFDERLPLAADGGPHIAFNPWLEARFPDGGQGGGMRSNCMACHRRASYPAAPFLPVTRGEAKAANDMALSPDRLRTSFLWSLPMHAQP